MRVLAAGSDFLVVRLFPVRFFDVGRGISGDHSVGQEVDFSSLDLYGGGRFYFVQEEGLGDIKKYFFFPSCRSIFKTFTFSIFFLSVTKSPVIFYTFCSLLSQFR